MWSDEEPAEDEACAKGVDEYVRDEEGCAMGKEMLAEFHSDSVGCGCRDDEYGVFEAWNEWKEDLTQCGRHQPLPVQS